MQRKTEFEFRRNPFAGNVICPPENIDFSTNKGCWCNNSNISFWVWIVRKFTWKYISSSVIRAKRYGGVLGPA